MNISLGKLIMQTGVGILALLFSFSGAAKVLWCHYFERALRQYPVTLSPVMIKAIIVLLPVLEVFLAVLVCTKKCRVIALYSMLFLLVAFTTLQIKVKALG